MTYSSSIDIRLQITRPIPLGGSWWIFWLRRPSPWRAGSSTWEMSLEMTKFDNEKFNLELYHNLSKSASIEKPTRLPGFELWPLTEHRLSSKVSLSSGVGVWFAPTLWLSNHKLLKIINLRYFDSFCDLQTNYRYWQYRYLIRCRDTEFLLKFTRWSVVFITLYAHFPQNPCSGILTNQEWKSATNFTDPSGAKRNISDQIGCSRTYRYRYTPQNWAHDSSCVLEPPWDFFFRE